MTRVPEPTVHFAGTYTRSRWRWEASGAPRRVARIWARQLAAEDRYSARRAAVLEQFMQDQADVMLQAFGIRASNSTSHERNFFPPRDSGVE
jgi:hypothetical protein